MPTSTNYFEFVIDPSTGNQIEVRDKYAREQLVHKTEKTVVNSLPAKPTTYDAWLAMERFIYFVPIDGEENQYEAWTLFFIGDPTVPADYTDTDNYEWVQIAVTDTDLTNFSTKGHTHEVIPETEVEDHDYTPQGTVESQFSGTETTTDSKTHSHTITPSGSVSASFSGSAGTTGNNSTGISLNKSSKKLSTKKLNVSPATSVNFTGSTTNAQRATGALETLSSYDASKAVFNGINITDGVLSFVTKKMTTADTVSGLQASIDASKVSFDGNGTVANQDLATGAVESGTDLLGNDTGITDSGHTHSFTPEGSVDASFSGTQSTTSEDTHTHAVTPTGSVSSSFNGMRVNLKHKVDNKKVRTSPDSEDEGSHAYDWYGILFDEDEDDPQKTRVGNMDMHRMLPIQTKMRRCILNDDGTVNYYLDDRDSTKRAGSQEGWVTKDEIFISKTETDDILNATEYFEQIKGHSVVWNQFVPLFNASGKWLVTRATASISEDGLEVAVTGNNASNVGYFLLAAYPSTTHKYYMACDYKASIDSVNTAFKFFGNSITTLERDNQYHHLSNICTVATLDRFFIYAGNGETMTVKNLYILDLTLMGIDNLTTVAQVEEWLSKNVGLKDCYDYNAGSILNNNMKGLATNGANIGSHTYDFDVTKIYGQLNGEGDYVQVYPNGMIQTNNVKDILTKDTAYCNAPNINLGSLTWTKSSGTTAYFSANVSNIKGTSGWTTKPNAMCAKYRVGTPNESQGVGNVPDTISINNDKIFVYPSATYVDGAAFKTANSNIYINCEYNTPLIYTNLVYRDNGVDTPLGEYLMTIEADRNCTITVLPPIENNVEQMMAAPELTMKKYVSQALANLDGSDGQVMVEIPEHWRKVYTYLDGAKTMVKAMISPYLQETTGWIHVRKGYISAYEASIIDGKLCSVSDIVNLTLSMQDGKVHASCDVSVIGETGQPADWATYIAGTHSLFPTTSVTMAAMRTAARARHTIDGDPDTRWNQQVYEQYVTLFWLYIIEYANLNSQADINTALDYEGFHQGGLGAGVTTVNATAWNNFNAYKPFVPCGITNCLGNHTGEVILSLPSAFSTNIKVAVNSYRGVEMPFGHIFKFADGIKYLGDGTQQAVLRCGNPANYSSASNSDNYTSIGNNIGSDGYKTKIMIGDDGDINCKAVGGGALKAYCDYNYQAHTNGTYFCCLLGGNAHYGTFAGLACVHSHYSVSYTYARIGSRLCFFEK